MTEGESGVPDAGASGRAMAFLSYSREDVEAACAIQSGLQQHGVRVWRDHESLVPGDPWQKKIEEAIRTADAVIAVVGKPPLGEWQDQEVSMAIAERRARPELRIVPVLIPGAGELSKSSSFLSQFSALDFSAGVDPHQLAQLAGAITGDSEFVGPIDQASSKRFGLAQWAIVVTLLVAGGLVAIVATGGWVPDASAASPGRDEPVRKQPESREDGPVEPAAVDQSSKPADAPVPAKTPAPDHIVYWDHEQSSLHLWYSSEGMLELAVLNKIRNRAVSDARLLLSTELGLSPERVSEIVDKHRIPPTDKTNRVDPADRVGRVGFCYSWD